jgi:hypothetical protein
VKNKKLPIIILLCIFFFGIGYWVSNLKKDGNEDSQNKKNDETKKKQVFDEPNDLEGYWVSDKDQAFKITKKGSKYTVNIGYKCVETYTYKDGKISDYDTTYTKLEKGNDKFAGIWQGEKRLTGTIKYMMKILITKGNGKYTCKYWDTNNELIEIDSDESIYLKAKNKLLFYSTYKSTNEVTWDKEDGSLKNKNTFDKYTYKKKNKDSIIYPTSTTTKRKDVERYDYFTRVR